MISSAVGLLLLVRALRQMFRRRRPCSCFTGSRSAGHLTRKAACPKHGESWVRLSTVGRHPEDVVEAVGQAGAHG